MGVIGQADFGAGMYRGREAPDNSAFDMRNLLIDDEGQPYRRGGSEFRSTSNHGATLLGLADAYVYAGRRTLSWGSTASQFYVLDGSNAPVTLPRFSTGAILPADFPFVPLTRTATVRGFLMIPTQFGTPGAGMGGAFLYAGSLMTSVYSGGSIAATAGSKTITGTSTTFVSSGVDKGAIIQASSGDDFVGIVDAVGSNTSLTLTEPAPRTFTGASVQIAPKMPFSSSNLRLNNSRQYVASVAGRAILALGTRVALSIADTPFSREGSAFPQLNDEYYHELPADAVIFGIDGIRDTAIVFTATGVWAITNLLYDALDDVGNIQQQVQQVNKDLILWSDNGIAAYRNALVVPGIDDVVLLADTGETEVISSAIRPLYRSYVKAGYQLGTASVHRGHYHLPIVDQSNVIVDYFTCRLDRGFAWTRWSGHGAGIATSARVTDPARSPLLFGINAQRITDLSDTLDPSSSNITEADGTTHTWLLDTHDYATPGGRRGSVTRKIRVRYEATGAISVSALYARGLESASYSSLGTAVTGGTTSDGLDEAVWPVSKQAPAIRFRISGSGATETFKLREIEVHTRERGL